MKFWKHRWFILSVTVFLFFAITSVKVVMADQASNLTAVLNAGLQGLKAFFDFLLETLKFIW